MMRMEPVSLDGFTALAIEVKLPKTTLLVVTTDKGYIMCGACSVCGFYTMKLNLIKWAKTL
ncbi:MAG: hypothetical protein K0S39_530 [Paenibacillus sp.]|nr:hypothetical protein [Paenibacillus sp.]